MLKYLRNELKAFIVQGLCRGVHLFLKNDLKLKYFGISRLYSGRVGHWGWPTIYFRFTKQDSIDEKDEVDNR